MLQQLLMRRTELAADQESLMAQILQAQHKVSEYAGAITELDHWIEYLQQGGSSDATPIETLQGQGQNG
jgi:hypothetical protein